MITRRPSPSGVRYGRRFALVLNLWQDGDVPIPGLAFSLRVVEDGSGLVQVA